MDRAVKNQCIEIIKKHYPNVEEKEIKTNSGFDHNIFIVNNEKTFRFPKTPKIIDVKRSALLEQFASTSPLPLPIIEIYTDEKTSICYEINDFIPGVSFYPSIAQMFAHQNLFKIAKKLGEFLSAVHSFPVEKAREIELDEMNPNDFWEYMEQNPDAYPRMKKVVFPNITETEQKWIEKLFIDYIALIKATPFKARVTHADMWVYHIIVDPEKQTLNGVIDFWGRIADPANDFKAFEYYGSDFVNEVYKSYELPIDDYFDKRRLFYTGHDEVYELARSIENKDEQKIDKHKRSLSDYIKNHPMV